MKQAALLSGDTCFHTRATLEFSAKCYSPNPIPTQSGVPLSLYESPAVPCSR